MSTESWELQASRTAAPLLDQVTDVDRGVGDAGADVGILPALPARVVPELVGGAAARDDIGLVEAIPRDRVRRGFAVDRVAVGVVAFPADGFVRPGADSINAFSLSVPESRNS